MESHGVDLLVPVVDGNIGPFHKISLALTVNRRAGSTATRTARSRSRSPRSRTATTASAPSSAPIRRARTSPSARRSCPETRPCSSPPMSLAPPPSRSPTRTTGSRLRRSRCPEARGANVANSPQLLHQPARIQPRGGVRLGLEGQADRQRECPPSSARPPADRRASGARTSPARTPCTARRSSSSAGTPSTSSRT